MVKPLLKRFLPIVVLKNISLGVNRIKRAIVDPILFPNLKIEPESFIVKRSLNPFLALKISLKEYSNEVRDGLKIWTDPKWMQDEYLLVLPMKGWIEPKAGWGITMDGKLIYPSLGFSHAPYVRTPGFFNTHFRNRKATQLTSIISLRDTGEENYFHFFNDVITKLFFCRDQGIELHSFKIVISRNLSEKEYFKGLCSNTWLKDLQWVVQTDEWIQFETAVFCKPLTHTFTYFKEAVRLTNRFSRLPTNRRLFLTRDSQSLRFVENLNEISPILKKYEFEIIDPATGSWQDQVNNFFDCRYLIGIHGAGLTNMIFREGKPLGILEIIHPFAYIPFHYMMLANQFQFNYDLIMGKKGKQWATGGFYLEPADLEEAIKKLIYAPSA